MSQTSTEETSADHFSHIAKAEAACCAPVSDAPLVAYTAPGCEGHLPLLVQPSVLHSPPAAAATSPAAPAAGTAAAAARLKHPAAAAAAAAAACTAASAHLAALAQLHQIYLYMIGAAGGCLVPLP